MGAPARKLVVDATKYGNLVRFIGVTSDASKVNVDLAIGHCDCGISDPLAVLVATATKNIREGDRLLRYKEPDEKAYLGPATLEPADETESKWPGCVCCHVINC